MTAFYALSNHWLYNIRVFSLHTDCSDTKRNESGEQTIRIWDDNDDPITLKYAISNLQFCTYMNMSRAEQSNVPSVPSALRKWENETKCFVCTMAASTAKVTHSHDVDDVAVSIFLCFYYIVHLLCVCAWGCEVKEHRDYTDVCDSMSVCMT